MFDDGIELFRQEWEEGNRRVEASRGDDRRYRRLVDQVAIVTEELRRRVGQTYSLRDLASAYADADRWAREALEAREPAAGWPRDVALVQAAAFHAYQRGAADYAS